MPESDSISATSLGARAAPLEPLEELTRLWAQGARDHVDAFLETIGPLSATQLVELVHVDQHHRWQAGERTAAEHYLERFPDLCADNDAVVDIIFHEYLLRERLAEHPGLQEYADRFPNHAEGLKNQITFHRLLKESESPLAEPNCLATANLHGASLTGLAGQAEINFAPHGGLSSSQEVQSLLRKRLWLLSIFSCAAFLLYLPVLGALVAGTWGIVPYGLMLAQTSICAVLLARRRPISTQALRWIEASFFGDMLLFCIWKTTEVFGAISIGQLVAFHWIGPIMAARNVSWTWAVMIIVYGIWIPNTTRRTMTVVAGMVVAFLVVTLSLVLTDESAPASAAAGFILFSVTDVFFAAAIAVFGAHRIQTLQRAASELRKIGPYRLIRLLGAGGMGEVYLAQHALLRRPCAIKLIRSEKGADLHSLACFEREVQTMATLTHPNTVRIYDYGLDADGTYYYAMEYLQGLSLQELVSRDGPIPSERVVHLLRQVCGALHEAHGVALVHGDIKPANILACQIRGMHDVVKLLDFGLVRVQKLSSNHNGLTNVLSIAGTPAFMSPEQAAGATEVDARSDLYGLGAVAYFLLTGQPPFLHPTSIATLGAPRTDSIAPPRELRHGVCPDLETVVMRCLEGEPERRFQNAAALEEALSRCACAGGWSSEQAAACWKDADAS